MELNIAQLLVHDDTTLNKFWTDHDIPEGVRIEHPQPNEDANLTGIIFQFVFVDFVRTVFAVDTLMLQMKLPFSVEDLLHIYIVVRSRREPSIPFLAGWGQWSFIVFEISTIDSNASLKITRPPYGPSVIALALVDQPEVEPILLGKPLLGKRKGKQPAGVPPRRLQQSPRDASYATTTLAQNEVVTPTAQKDKALQELTKLRATACGPVYNKEAQANEVTALKGEAAKEGVGTVAAEAGGPAVEVGENYGLGPSLATPIIEFQQSLGDGARNRFEGGEGRGFSSWSPFAQMEMKISVSEGGSGSNEQNLAEISDVGKSNETPVDVNGEKLVTEEDENVCAKSTAQTEVTSVGLDSASGGDDEDFGYGIAGGIEIGIGGDSGVQCILGFEMDICLLVHTVRGLDGIANGKVDGMAVGN
ncbi:hypothetical protein Acr_09g0005190 [Actinidia rufa]|uniref:Uncharacterized protein n=1 Tax=Actinidia rufa TaxID=165716 RepID=A0A7J0F638_9ERIC|nr:hypothetical protein Acr_09g0005190 [Actinidia rufa]